jgi:hypothetical protein
MSSKGMLVGFFLVAACLGEGVAVGCDCIPNPKPRPALRSAGAVFAGRIVALNSSGVVLEVSRVWKGVAFNQGIVEVMTPVDACMFIFEADREYLVYAYREEKAGALYTSICTRTNLLSKAEEDVRKLGHPRWNRRRIAHRSPWPSDPAHRLDPAVMGFASQ